MTDDAVPLIRGSVGSLLFWAPRILAILFALFISLFALDAVKEGTGLLTNVANLFVHLIPTFVILLVLAAAWRWEWIGAAAYVALGVFYLVTARGRFDWSTYALISGPLFLIGAMFFACWIYRGKLRAAPFAGGG